MKTKSPNWSLSWFSLICTHMHIQSHYCIKSCLKTANIKPWNSDLNNSSLYLLQKKILTTPTCLPLPEWAELRGFMLQLPHERLSSSLENKATRPPTFNSFDVSIKCEFPWIQMQLNQLWFIFINLPWWSFSHSLIMIGFFFPELQFLCFKLITFDGLLFILNHELQFFLFNISFYFILRNKSAQTASK